MIYICGRDLQKRPVLYINAQKLLITKIAKEDILNTVTYILTIIKTFMFHPGKIENFLLIINVCNLNFNKVNLEVIP